MVFGHRFQALRRCNTTERCVTAEMLRHANRCSFLDGAAAENNIVQVLQEVDVFLHVHGLRPRVRKMKYCVEQILSVQPASAV